MSNTVCRDGQNLKTYSDEAFTQQSNDGSSRFDSSFSHTAVIGTFNLAQSGTFHLAATGHASADEMPPEPR
jgi:hypothetical protein